MAGIGFEIKRILKRETLNHVLRAYSYAGVIASGPWVISVIAIAAIYLLRVDKAPETQQVLLQFQTSITYLISLSLLFSGLVQYAFVRYIADRLFEKKDQQILPNIFGVLCLTSVGAFILGCLYSRLMLADTPLLYRIASVGSLVALVDIWVVASLLTGVKAYREILIAFIIGYGATVLLCYYGWQQGISGLLLGFFVGQALLFLSLLFIVIRYYFCDNLLAFDFLAKHRIYLSLVFTGVFYNFAIWVDKYCFWFYPGTGQRVIGSLHASLIYDLPMFLSFFLLIPGLTVFLLRIETDFVDHCKAYYDAIREGGSLTAIAIEREQMVQSIHQSLLEIIKIQALFTLVGFIYSAKILTLFNFPIVQVPLFRIDMVAIDLLVFFLALLNIIFYLNKRRQALGLTACFFVLNLSLTLLSLHIGVYAYGYGLLMALLATNGAALILLDRNFNRLTFETFVRVSSS